MAIKLAIQLQHYRLLNGRALGTLENMNSPIENYFPFWAMWRKLAALLLFIMQTNLAWSDATRDTEDWGSMPRGWPLEEFTLIDQHGEPFLQKQLLGRWTFILLGDTNCAEPCETALAALTGLRQRIASSQKLKTTQVLFVSLGQESPGRLRAYLAPYDKHIIGAQGTPEIVAQLAKDLGMEESLATASNGKARQYPGTVALIEPEGTVRTLLVPPFEATRLTARYLKIRMGR